MFQKHGRDDFNKLAASTSPTTGPTPSSSDVQPVPPSSRDHSDATISDGEHEHQQHGKKRKKS